MRALILALCLGAAAGAQSDVAIQEAKVLAWEARVASTQPPEVVMDAMGLKPGMVMGEVGAGQGRFTLHFARRVGSQGRIYANDIRPEGLAFLAQRCHKHGVTNVQTVLGTASDPRFPTQQLDLIGMVWTYHMMEKPVAMLKGMVPYLRPGGRLAMVEPRPREIEQEIREATARTGKTPVDIHLVNREHLAREAAQAGLLLEHVDETSLGKDVVYVLRKPSEDLVEPQEKRLNQLQPPDRIMDAIWAQPGMVIGEVGAGHGRLTVHLARRVGPRGHIYANDIDRTALEHLKTRCEQKGFTHVVPVLAEPQQAGFPAHALDMVFMINVYNAFQDPVDYLRKLKGSLKPGGTVAIVLDDPAKSGGESPRSTPREQFLDQVARAGYTVSREEGFLKREALFVLRPVH